jgi:gliding motility-associated-like protein
MIEVPETIIAEVTVEDQELGCDAPTVVLEPFIVTGNPVDIKWLWSNGSTDPMIVVNTPGRYSVMVDDGCAERNYTINVDWSEELRQEDFFFVPNVFSPNDDGINDELHVFPGPDFIIRYFEFRIFDRWGTLLFGTNRIEDSWDGAFHNVRMEPGVYVWYLKAKVEVCGIRDLDVLYKSDVTIAR